MFFKTKSEGNKPDELEIAVNATLASLAKAEPASKEYSQLLNAVSKLTDLQKVRNSMHRVSPDTLAMIGANLLGILLILNHERAGVVASKALGFVKKLS